MCRVLVAVLTCWACVGCTIPIGPFEIEIDPIDALRDSMRDKEREELEEDFARARAGKSLKYHDTLDFDDEWRLHELRSGLDDDD